MASSRWPSRPIEGKLKRASGLGNGRGMVPAQENGPSPKQVYCASCHVRDAKGDGPAAGALKVPPADLTALAKKNNGKFPSNHVSAVLSGQADMMAHGSKDMPVWGPIFFRLSEGRATEVQQRISNLTLYLKTLQTQ